MSSATTLAFLWTALLIELTPGPNMTFLALLAARRGTMAALAAVAGVTVGLATMGLAASLGFGMLTERLPVLFDLLRWAGVGYLLWLAVDAWREAGGVGVADGLASPQRLFVDGLVTNLLNPKAAVFFVSVLPAFTDAARPLRGQTFLLTLLYLAVATVVHLAIVVAAGRAALLLDDQRLRRRVGRGLALGLAAVALWLAWTTQR